MASVNHPHLVRLLCLCMAPRVMLLTELMGLGSLLGYLRSRKRTLTGETLLLFGKQIAAVSSQIWSASTVLLCVDRIWDHVICKVTAIFHISSFLF